jgi:hypothetical protein
MDLRNPHSLFRAIEALEDLHLVEPRFGCAARAQKIGKFFKGNGITPGRLWALPKNDQRNFTAPLLDVFGNPFLQAFLHTPDGSNTREIGLDTSRRLMWNHHVTAIDVTDLSRPLVYDPVMFSGPVTVARWMSVFDKSDASAAPYFVKTEWHTAPVNSWMGTTFSPGHANEHDPYTDDDRARFELAQIVSLSQLGVPFKRFNPAWTSTPN